MSNLVLVAPVDGWAAPLEEVPDPVFSERILGDGLAIDPTGATLNAPCDGFVTAPAKHAVNLRAANGAEILIHVGLETVALGGQGFISHVRDGRMVKAGEPLLSFDLDFLAARVKSLISPVIVTNSEAFKILRSSQGRAVKTGEFLMEIAPLTAGAGTVGGGPAVSRAVAVPLANGIHARPAALLANCAKGFEADSALIFRGRRANARSVVALMSLGVGTGESVSVTAEGPDAERAVAAIAELIAAGLGETPVRAAAKPVARIAAPQPAPASADGIIRGVRAAPGLAVGRATHFRVREIAVAEEGRGIAHETAELRRARGAVRARLEEQAAAGDKARRDILSAHVALLDDPELEAAALALIGQGRSAGAAWRQAVRAGADALRAMADVRMRERADDLLDLERQVLAALTGETPAPADLPDHAILLAEDILPSDLVSLPREKLAGLVTASGGPTSHVAILAAGMNLPALAGAGPAIRDVAEGSDVVLNADQGFLDTRPAPEAIVAARENLARAEAARAAALAAASRAAMTADGTRIEVFANLGTGAAEARAAVGLGAEGCGLLRTEFLFLDRETPPTEDEQYEQYQAIADALDGRPFILRTLDIGGDKPVAYLPFPPEENPALGLRGIRTGFWWPDILRTQLAAILRVTPHGRCRIMLPMVSSVSELVAVRTILDALREERGEIAKIPLGVMIETPASALIADRLAEEADFLSIGTNDLTQYVLAMDRGHRLLANQIDALHPAVLRLIARAAESGREAGKPVAVCGGLASDPSAAALLIGLGVGELSASPPAIPMLKAAIHKLDMKACRALAQEALAQDSAAAVRALLQREREAER